MVGSVAVKTQLFQIPEGHITAIRLISNALLNPKTKKVYLQIMNIYDANESTVPPTKLQMPGCRHINSYSS